MKFKDRTGSNLNRRKLKIISQTAEEMIVDVERADKPDDEGTPINADIMNQLQKEIDTANINSSSAISTADSAIETANSAKEKAIYVESQLADRGATVKINGTSQSEINFSSNPQEQIDSKLNKNFTSMLEKTSLDTEDLFVLQDNNDNSTPKETKKIKYGTLKTLLLDTIYPIGSIYMSVNGTDPEILFGGKWDPLKDRFLLGAGDAYSSGANGGEATHTLTTNEMPSHTHTQNAHGHQVYGGGDRDSYCYGANYGTIGLGGCINDKNLGYVTNSNNGNSLIRSTTATNNYTGGGQAHNNMPPYLVVHMWKRIN